MAASYEQLATALRNAHRAGDTAAAQKLARAIKAMRAAPAAQPASQMINDRVAEAHDASGDTQVVRAGILPMSVLRKGGENIPGTAQFDQHSGLMGMALSAARLPGEVYAGKTQLLGPDGNINPAVIGRTTELASMVTGGTAVPKSASTAMARRAALRNVDQADEFGIGLSRGQATGRFADQAFEEDALTGGRGAVAQRAFAQQREAQRGQVEAAAENLIARQSPSDVDPQTAAMNTAQALRGTADDLRARSDAAYRATEASQAEFAPESIGGLANSLRTSLDDLGALEGRFVAPEYPTAARALQRVDTLLSKTPDGNVIGVGWQNLERIRRVLNGQGASQDEARVLKGMRASFDDWVQASVDNALVNGDKAFLDNVQEARGLWRQYKEIVGNPSNIIRRMADGSANSEQIANWLYGASKVGGKTDSANVVREIKRLIGPDHPAIAELRQGVMQRLLLDRQGATKTYGRLAADINEFATQRALAGELFGDEAIAEMKRFANVLRTLTPDSLATNPSRSGQTIARRAREATNTLAPFVGFAAADLWGAIAALGVRAVGGANAGRRARQAITLPVPTAPKQTFAPRQSIPAIGVQAASADDRRLTNQFVPLPRR